MISRMAFWSLQASRILEARLGPMPATSISRSPCFVNRQGAAMTRFGVRYLLHKHLSAAARTVPSLADKRLHPHSLRHTTAIHLLKAGVD